ncbi:MAG: hypothetical protein Q7T80_15435 [Methanoregula sp.]|nr:hypothetical protein [Methanoregula sp.]
MIPNTEWKKVLASLIAAVVFAVTCFISYTAIDGMNGGYALAFVSFFLAVSSIAVALHFVHRARVMDVILSDPSPLAHWSYPEEIARASVEREYGEYRERNRIMFYIIGGMLGLVALFFLIFVGDGGPETALILLGLMVILFIVSRIAPGIERQRAMGAPHAGFIAHSGLIYEGTVYPFHSFLVWWHGCTFHEASKKRPAVIIFSFSQLVGRFIIQPFEVTIPVPAGEEENAKRIVQELGGKIPY